VDDLPTFPAFFCYSFDNKTMEKKKIIDERGRLFGKINILDFMVLFFIFACILPMTYFGYRLYKRPNVPVPVKVEPPPEIKVGVSRKWLNEAKVIEEKYAIEIIPIEEYQHYKEYIDAFGQFEKPKKEKRWYQF
jgi:hypothetical protein